MIDMVFLLLVFFMCVSSITQASRQVKVNLPESVASEVPKDLSGRVILTIDSGERFHLAGGEIEPDRLGAELVRLAESYPGSKLLVRAEGATPFAVVKRALRAAAEAGISDIVYAAYQTSDG